jgi:hypothetical protein
LYLSRNGKRGVKVSGTLANASRIVSVEHALENAFRSMGLIIIGWVNPILEAVF